MVHGDDQGLRLPPTVAATQVVVVPIARKPDESASVLAAAKKIVESLEAAGIRVRLDNRDGVSPGFKFNDCEMRGIPLRIEIGPRDVAAGQVVFARRDRKGPTAKSTAPVTEAAPRATALLGEIKESLYQQALAAMQRETREFQTYAELKKQMEGEGGGGFASIFWCGNPACETRIREETRATCRAIPFNQSHPAGICIVCGEPAPERAFFAKSY
jgi:prolyl-tRNA synthetase